MALGQQPEGSSCLRGAHAYNEFIEGDLPVSIDVASREILKVSSTVVVFSSEEASVTPGVGQVFIFLSCSLLVITSLLISLVPTRPPAVSEDLFHGSTLLIPT